MPARNNEALPVRDHVVAGYAELVERFGADAVADAILAKWLADHEAGGSWARLAAAVRHAGDPNELADELLESAERVWRPAWERNRPRLGDRGDTWGD